MDENINQLYKNHKQPYSQAHLANINSSPSPDVSSSPNDETDLKIIRAFTNLDIKEEKRKSKKENNQNLASKADIRVSTTSIAKTSSSSTTNFSSSSTSSLASSSRPIVSTIRKKFNNNFTRRLSFKSSHSPKQLFTPVTRLPTKRSNDSPNSLQKQPVKWVESKEVRFQQYK